MALALFVLLFELSFHVCEGFPVSLHEGVVFQGKKMVECPDRFVAK